MGELFDSLKKDVENAVDKVKEGFEDIQQGEADSLDQWHDLFAWADGNVQSYPFQDDQVSEKNQRMKTLIVMEIKTDQLNVPANGTITRIDPANNTICEQIGKNEEVAIKVCTGKVNFDKQATVLVQAGQKVEKGQPLVKFSAPVLAKSKLMLVRPESVSDYAKQSKAAAIQMPGSVSAGQKLIEITK